jgi:hypothetical protein
MRVLLVVPPLTGHVEPLRAVAAALAANGHEVAWCGPQPATSALTGANLVYPAGASEPFDVEHRPAACAALRFLWQPYLVPLADAMAPGVRVAVRRFAPDLVVPDQQALAGALAAIALAVPSVTSASTATELADPLRSLPKVAECVRQLQHELCLRHGVPLRDPRFSPERVLAFTTRELTGAPSGEFAAAVRYVGSATARSSAGEFGWSKLDGRPLVMVPLGTANARSGVAFSPSPSKQWPRRTGFRAWSSTRPVRCAATPYWWSPGSPRSNCCGRHRFWSATPGTTRSARDSPRASQRSSHRSATTSP